MSQSKKSLLDRLSAVIVPFGKHKGKTLDETPLQYLDWMIGESWIHAKYPKFTELVRQYLEHPTIARELANELEDDYPH